MMEIFQGPIPHHFTINSGLNHEKLNYALLILERHISMIKCIDATFICLTKTFLQGYFYFSHSGMEWIRLSVALNNCMEFSIYVLIQHPSQTKPFHFLQWASC